MNASWGNASTIAGKLQYHRGSTGVFPREYWPFLISYVPTPSASLAVVARGERPFMRRKNLLSEGEPAKWRRSAICWMLRLDVRSRKATSIMSIWLM